MNILVIILIILMLWKIWRGLKNGFAKEINRVISLFLALVVLSVVFLLIACIVEKNMKMTFVSVALLLIVSIFCRITAVVIKSVETLAKLPLIRTVNGLFGAVAGMFEVIIVFWIMYAVMDGFPTGSFGEQVMAWTRESPFLSYIYNKNYILHWLLGLKG